MNTKVGGSFSPTRKNDFHRRKVHPNRDWTVSGNYYVSNVLKYNEDIRSGTLFLKTKKKKHPHDIGADNLKDVHRFKDKSTIYVLVL
jgi:hypothetical protein